MTGVLRNGRMTGPVRRGTAGVAVAAALLGTTAAGAAGAAAWGSTSRVSVSSTGEQADNTSVVRASGISAHGRYVAFTSLASNLVRGDTNFTYDVFVRDRLAGVTRLVSVGLGGEPADNESGSPTVSASGRYVAFASSAANLVAGDTNNASDVFVRDLATGVTTRVSVGPGGRLANGFSRDPVISADGLHVAFGSDASNLVAADTNGTHDIFVRDLLAGATRRVSVGPSGRQANGLSFSPAISADGRFIAFESVASNLVAGDTNGYADVFVRDRLARTTRRVSVGAGGRQSDRESMFPAISANGRYVAFLSVATNLIPGDNNAVADVFVRDRVARLTSRVSVGPGERQADGASVLPPAISATGRYVSFSSAASNLVAADTNGERDVFVRDRLAAVTWRVSVGTGGEQGDNRSFSSAISADGRHVAFHSIASNLVAADTNRASDVFVRDRIGDVAPG